MTAIASHLSAADLEARYETAADPVSKSHFHAIRLLSLGHTVSEVAALLSFQRAGSGCSASATMNTDRTAWATGDKAMVRCPRS